MTKALLAFGYTPREAAFLRIASLLSGYFVRRHFNDCIGKECGAVAQAFLERAAALGHVRAFPALGRRVVYHVCAFAVYSALGDSNNRNRREHRPDTIRRRLMALDFALLGPAENWLLTEDEKLKGFSDLGIPADDLPSQRYGSKAKTFFVDRLPISHSADRGPRFAFVDEGLQTLSQWELFLKSHRLLFQRLEKAEVVFAGCEPSRFRAAENLFRRTVAGQSTSGLVDVERLRRYFAARKLFDQKRFEGFDKARLDELREAKRVFAAPEFDSLYAHWCSSEEVELRVLSPSRITFHSQVLPHAYEWLSPIRLHERRA